MELDPPEYLMMGNLLDLSGKLDLTSPSTVYIIRMLDRLDDLVLRCSKRVGAWSGWFTHVLDPSKKQELEELISKLVEDIRTYKQDILARMEILLTKGQKNHGEEGNTLTSDVPENVPVNNKFATICFLCS